MNHSVTALYQRHFRFVLATTLAGFVVAAWYMRFLQDDAFISFRYADNLVRGFGLVWNPGDHVEGYTNFLWTLVISAGMAAGLDPVPTSQILGICFFFLTLVFTYRISLLVSRSRTAGLVTIFLLGTNYTFLSYATGGLETQMQISLCTIIIFLCLNGISTIWTPTRLFLLSFLIAGAILTRLDSVVLLAPFTAYAVIAISRTSTPRKQRTTGMAFLILPAAFIIVSWFFWKHSLYGNLLPNSFYLKAGGKGSFHNGTTYLLTFFASYLFFPIIVAVIPFIKQARQTAEIVLMMIALLLWTTYIVLVGGDFMEFRFMAPLLPFLFILFTWASMEVLRSAFLHTAFMVIPIIASVYHANVFAYDPRIHIEPIAMLNGHLTHPYENWIGIGKRLGELFNQGSGVTIATTAAGAIPYYSHLRSVDMLGVNDSWVADSGYEFTSFPGHQKIASLGYLLSRNVHLLISHPLVLPRAAFVTDFPMPPAGILSNLPEFKLIELPLTASEKLIVLYMTPHPTVDSLIAAHNWKTSRFPRD